MTNRQVNSLRRDRELRDETRTTLYNSDTAVEFLGSVPSPEFARFIEAHDWAMMHNGTGATTKAVRLALRRHLREQEGGAR